jgi:hypothetical protein
MVALIAGTMVASAPELWFNTPMLKTEAIQLLGGSVTAAAAAIGVTYQAVDKWPDVLPQRITDRVQAAMWRRVHGQASPPKVASAVSQPAREAS